MADFETIIGSEIRGGRPPIASVERAASVRAGYASRAALRLSASATPALEETAQEARVAVAIAVAVAVAVMVTGAGPLEGLGSVLEQPLVLRNDGSPTALAGRQRALERRHAGLESSAFDTGREVGIVG